MQQVIMFIRKKKDITLQLRINSLAQVDGLTATLMKRNNNDKISRNE